MQSLLIRYAIVSEKEMLEGLQLRASLTNAGDREAVLAHPDAIELPIEQLAGGRVFVAEWNGTIAGFSAIEPRADGGTELDGLFVEPKMRRRGIGRQLVEYCTEAARGKGSIALYVIGNPHAEEFYRQCGFKQTGTVATRFGVGLLLNKVL